MVRDAFSMIELIFSLVVMGFVLISMQTGIINNSKSLEGNIVQEAMFAASTQINQIRSFHWDDQSSQAGVALAAVLDMPVQNDFNRTNSGSIPGRVGHFQQPKHRRMFNTPTYPTTPAALGLEGAFINDIDDFNTPSPRNLFISGTQEASGYKNRYTMDIKVEYVADNGNVANYYNPGVALVNNPFIFEGQNKIIANATNLKRITINVDQNNTDGTSTPIVSLQVFSANIGEIDYHHRTY